MRLSCERHAFVDFAVRLSCCACKPLKCTETFEKHSKHVENTLKTRCCVTSDCRADFARASKLTSDRRGHFVRAPTSENNANLVLYISTCYRSSQRPKTMQTTFCLFPQVTGRAKTSDNYANHVLVIFTSYRSSQHLRKQRKPRFCWVEPTYENNANHVLVISISYRSRQNLRTQRSPRFGYFHKLPVEPTSENNANHVLVISTIYRATQPPKTTQTSFALFSEVVFGGWVAR